MKFTKSFESLYKTDVGFNFIRPLGVPSSSDSLETAREFIPTLAYPAIILIGSALVFFIPALLLVVPWLLFIFGIFGVAAYFLFRITSKVDSQTHSQIKYPRYTPEYYDKKFNEPSGFKEAFEDIIKKEKNSDQNPDSDQNDKNSNKQGNGKEEKWKVA